MSNLSGKYAIVGVGETQLGKVPNVSTLALHLDAIKRALEDAGLRNDQVNGLLTNQPMHDPMRCYGVVVAAAAGIKPRYTTDLALGGATPVGMGIHAAMAIEAGLADAVVCVHARNQQSKKLLPHRAEIRDGWEDFEVPYGLVSATANHSLAASRHMYEYGTTSKQLGAIAMATRKHANLNPSAQMYSKKMTLEDHQNSPWVVEPLHLLDCCLNSDGGGAYVVTSAERARDLKQKPVYILGFGTNNPHGNISEAPSLTTLGGKVSSGVAYKMAGLGPKDMNFAEIYDCFTITTLITLEDYGFCPKGEGGAWVQGGRIELGGELPVNTHGGLLSQAHIEGMLHVTEATKQLRGGQVEPARQVRNAKIGIVSGHGGSLCTHATMILSNEQPS